METYIYAVLTQKDLYEKDDLLHVKVGESKNPIRRIESMKTGNPGMRILDIWKVDSSKFENEAHDIADVIGKNVCREHWIFLDSEYEKFKGIIDYIAENVDPENIEEDSDSYFKYVNTKPSTIEYKGKFKSVENWNEAIDFVIKESDVDTTVSPYLSESPKFESYKEVDGVYYKNQLNAKNKHDIIMDVTNSQAEIKI